MLPRIFAPLARALAASVFASRIRLRCGACEAISCCHSSAALFTSSPSTFSGSIGSRHAQAA